MEVTDEITRIAGEIAQLYKDKIEDAGAYATLNLWDFTWEVEVDGKALSIYFNLPLSDNGFPYWKAVENGTKPHWVPVEALKQWIKVKPITPVPRNGQKEAPTIDQLAYAIQWSISKKGTQGKHLMAAAMNESDDLIDEIIEVLANQVANELDKEDETI